MKHSFRTMLLVGSGLMFFLGSASAKEKKAQNPDDLSKILQTFKIDFPEPEEGMALKVFADTLEQLCESKDEDFGIRFEADKRYATTIVELEQFDGQESINQLLKRVGIAQREVAGEGKVVLKPPVVDPKLVALLDTVTVDECNFDDTEAPAAVGYVFRLYKKGKKAGGKELKFDPTGSQKGGRMTLNLSDISLGQALKYVVDLGGVKLAYDAKSGVVKIAE